MSTTKAPIIAIVGRTNVGKSSLFNCMLKRREAIVADEPGTTRDSISARASWEGQDFWIVDTAGMKDPEDDFEFTIQEQIEQATESADIIMVTIEADIGITDDDRKLARQALKSKKTVVLAVNKADKIKGAKPEDYQRLGIKEIILTAATQNRGISELLDFFIANIPKASINIDPDTLTFALLGRPNVGKSYLFNTLAKKQQAIVAERAGTTRDINRAIVKYNKKSIQLLDTAGIRRSGKIERGVEKFSVIRSISAIEQADICALVMDVNELNTQLDQKIAGMIKEAGKGLIIIVSKWDSLKEREIEPQEELTIGYGSEEDEIYKTTADSNRKLSKAEKLRQAKSNSSGEGDEIYKTEFTRDQIAPQIQQNFAFVPWAPLIFTSSVTGQNVTKIFELLNTIRDASEKLISTPDLNRWLHQITDIHPPAGLKNKNPKLRYIIQEKDNPTNFKVYGSDTKFLHWSYKRFMDRKLREKYGFIGSPVKFWFFDSRDDSPAIYTKR